MRSRTAQAAEPPEVAEAEAAVDAEAELLSEVSQKATFPMRFGEEAEEFSFEVPDLVSLRSKAKELKVVTGRLAAKKEDCITGLNSKIIEWRLLARAKVAVRALARPKSRWRFGVRPRFLLCRLVF